MNTTSPIKPKRSKNILTSAGIVLAILAVVTVFVVGCGLLFIRNFSAGMCGNQIFQEVASPDNRYNAIVFQRDCGATTGFSTQISILRTSQTLADTSGGNIFAMDGHPDFTKIKLVWRSNTTLQVIYEPGFDIFAQEAQYRYFLDVIDIQYQAR